MIKKRLIITEFAIEEDGIPTRALTGIVPDSPYSAILDYKSLRITDGNEIIEFSTEQLQDMYHDLSFIIWDTPWQYMIRVLNDYFSCHLQENDYIRMEDMGKKHAIAS